MPHVTTSKPTDLTNFPRTHTYHFSPLQPTHSNSMSDKYGFKNAFLAMAGLQALTLACYDKLAGSKLTFALGTMSVYFTLGGACVCFCSSLVLVVMVVGPL